LFFLIISIIYLIIIRINITIVVCIKFVIVIDLYNLLNNCLNNRRDRKDYEDYCCSLRCSSCCLSNNYTSYIFVNLLYILIKDLYICIYCNNNVDFKLLLLILFSFVAIIIFSNCAFAITRDFNNYVDVLKVKEVSFNKLCLYLFCSNYNIFFVSCFDKTFFSFSNARLINI
jgi:hypothetical protein